MSGRRVTVLGAGVSGVALARLAHELGANVFLSDSGPVSERAAADLREAGVEFEEKGHTDRVFGSDLVLIGSGFPPSAPILGRVREHGIEIEGELDFVRPFLRAKLIGITGSNGKTTTTSLVAHIMRETGLDAISAGNIGMPLADAAGVDHDLIAIELSSFQLHWASRFDLDGAILTNIAPDHIDWHGSFENYANDKKKILSFVKEDGFTVVRAEDHISAPHGRRLQIEWGAASGDDIVSLDDGHMVARYRGGVLFEWKDTGLIGRHNMENIAFAMACASVLGRDIGGARRALGSFVPPPHRCALVAEIGGVRYVDDSKGTNIAATSTALSSIDGPKLVILGGRGKGEDYADLLAPLRAHARHAFLIGEEREAIASALERGGYMDFTRAVGMEDAVRKASELAEAGDVVLLSPACTSWDQYKNYGERGDHFAGIVKSLKECRS